MYLLSITWPKCCSKRCYKALARFLATVSDFFFFKERLTLITFQEKGGVDLAQRAAFLLKSLNKSFHSVLSTVLCLLNWRNQHALLPAFTYLLYLVSNVFGEEIVSNDRTAECKHSSNLTSSAASRHYCRNHSVCTTPLSCEHLLNTGTSLLVKDHSCCLSPSHLLLNMNTLVLLFIAQNTA